VSTLTAATSTPTLDAIDHQYTVRKVLVIWAAATLPMASLAWVVWPLLTTVTELNAGMTFWLLMVAGMMWEFGLALIVLRRELGTLRWSVVAPRIWAQQPRSPRTGQRSPRSWWALVPIVVVFAALTVVSELASPLLDALGWVAPAGTEARQLARPEFVGQWWILGVAFLSFAFNYFLGEELLFRGVLLPKMRGAFGKWDWLVNNLLFTVYHLHKVWALPLVFLTSLPFSWAARRFRTIWFSIILHSLEGVVLIVMVYAVVSGLYFA
jgi:membrane protease YdiL (CAAX protease family)